MFQKINKRKTVRTFYESADKETRKEADEFIELIKNGTLRPRRLPREEYNMDGYFEKAYESIKHLNRSKETKEMMMRAYEK